MFLELIPRRGYILNKSCNITMSPIFCNFILTRLNRIHFYNKMFAVILQDDFYIFVFFFSTICAWVVFSFVFVYAYTIPGRRFARILTIKGSFW